MVDITIGDYIITSDWNSYTIHKNIISENDKSKGKKVEKFVGHFTLMQTAVNKILEHSIQTSDAKKLSEVIKLIKETKDMIEDNLEIQKQLRKEGSR